MDLSYLLRFKVFEKKKLLQLFVELELLKNVRKDL